MVATSVAAAGSSPSNISPLNRVQTGLDTFDGLTPRLLDTGARSQVEGNLVQGVVLAVFDGCSALSSLSAVGGLPDCNVIGVSAELLNQNVEATNLVAGCQEVGLAEAALQALNDVGIRMGESVPQDSAARQEGSLVRVSKS